MMHDSNGPTQPDGHKDDQFRNSEENLSEYLKKDTKKESQEHSANIKIHSIYTSCKYAKPNPTQFREQAIVSSLFLQQLLYFNTFYSLMHAYFFFFCCFYKFKIMSDILPIVIQLVIVVIWSLFEWFRLNNGYSGNINETFPEFVSFILLTFANLVLTVGYIFIGAALIKMYFNIEIICIIIELIFIVFELIVCFSSISSIVKAQLLNRKYKKNKQKNIELEPVGYYDDEIDEDIDEKKPFARQSHQQNQAYRGYEQQSHYNQQDNQSYNNNYNNNFDGREIQRRVPDENQDPQASNYPYQNNYNQNNQGYRNYN